MRRSDRRRAATVARTARQRRFPMQSIWRKDLALVLGALVLGMVVVGLSVASGGSAGGDVIQVSDDPFTNPSSQHRTEVEPDTFAYGSTWVSAFQAGLSFATGSSGIAFATSSDHGHSFVQG